MDDTPGHDAILFELERLYRERYGAFVRVAATVLRDAEAARDAVQDAFARAVRSRATFDGRGSLEAWLFRIVVNTARSHRRVDELGTDVEREARAWNGGYRDAEEAAVRVLVSQLPERQRLVLFLRFYADLDYDGVAQALGIRPGTVAATLNSARSTLARRLEEFGS